MNLMHVVILAIIQGIAEFIPISSSGHLVLAEKLLGIREPKLLLDVTLHLGTLMAICVYFSKDLLNMFFDGISSISELLQGNRLGDVLYRNPYLKLFILAIIGTVPAGIAALLLPHKEAWAFHSLLILSIGFFFTAIVLFFTRRSTFKERGLSQLGFMDAIWVGFAQALAVFPGVSRSGMTIAMGLTRGLDRQLAFRFSFILSIPAVLGAFLLELRHLGGLENVNWPAYVLGAAISFVLGLIVIRIAEKIVIRGNFYLFSYYVFVVGIVTFISSFFNA